MLYSTGNGLNIIELGCSTGKTALSLAEHIPHIQIMGVDISEEAINFAQEKAKKKGYENVKFQVQDICNFPSDWTNKWEFVYVIDVIHDVAATSKAIAELYRILKPGGQAFVLDINLHTNIKDNINNPAASMAYSISLFHCMTVSLAEGGEGMGTAWGKEKAIEMFQNVGFTVNILQESGFKVIYLLTKCVL